MNKSDIASVTQVVTSAGAVVPSEAGNLPENGAGESVAQRNSPGEGIAGKRTASLDAAVGAIEASTTRNIGMSAPFAPSATADGIGASSKEKTDLPLGSRIIGRDDRAHHLALASATVNARLDPPHIDKSSMQPSISRTTRLARAKPRSRSDCQARCGVNGYCDPSDERGCGGIYCGRFRENV